MSTMAILYYAITIVSILLCHSLGINKLIRDQGWTERRTGGLGVRAFCQMALGFLRTSLDSTPRRLQKDVGLDIDHDQSRDPNFDCSIHSRYENPLTISLQSLRDYTSPVLSSSVRRVSLEDLAECLSRRLHEETDPAFECIVIPSFGKLPPSTVAVKKSTSDFLRGVGEDSKIIQRLIREDSHKELVGVEVMAHFKQVKVGAFLGILEDQMKRIKITSTDETRKGRKPTLC